MNRRPDEFTRMVPATMTRRRSLRLLGILVAGIAGGLTGILRSPRGAVAVAPRMKSFKATSITTTSAVIGWATDQAADSTVLYGTTEALGQQATDPTLEKNHRVPLTGLAPAT